MSILEYNGSAVLAMVGKDCVAIATDSRLGVQAQTIAMDFQKAFRVSDKIYIGYSGLATDIQSVQDTIQFRHNLYKLREERDMSPKAFSSMLSSLLYERRFGPWFVEPVIAGLDAEDKPYIAGFDLIGCPVECESFVVAGTCTNNLHGMCEALFRPDMDADELFEVAGQCLLAAVERDALSGWGAVVHVITKEGVATRQLKSRKD